MSRRNVLGFTLIEILVVVAIIGLLIGVLVPVVRRAQVSAQEVAVKAQMQNISSGLELFKGDFGYYPSSIPQQIGTGHRGENAADDRHSLTAGDYPIQGANRLAISLLGRDKLGCPAKRGGAGATYGLDALSDPGPDSYTGWYYSNARATGGGDGSFDGTWTATATDWTSAKRTPRKAAYINPEGFSIVNDDIAGGAANTYVPVICDKFDKKKGEKITSYTDRSIVLYFAANPRGQRITTTGTPTWGEEYFYVADNAAILPTTITQLPFCEYIEDPKALVVAEHMPHNKDGYILVSPGNDLQYLSKNKDDVVNWEK